MMGIDKVRVQCFKIPTEVPERDGTLEWDSTELVTVQLHMKDSVGLGYTYAHHCIAELIKDFAAPILKGSEELSPFVLGYEIKEKMRNLGNAGLTSSAIAAVDIALWDLQGKQKGESLKELVPKRHNGEVKFYGSGLFIDDNVKRLEKQIKEFKKQGIRHFKMKIGDGVENDLTRVGLVKELLDDRDELYVDANGRYQVKEALELAYGLTSFDITWFEEPISSDDISGLRYLRNHFPHEMNLVVGEYCYQHFDFLRLLKAKAVDILQVDTR